MKDKKEKGEAKKTKKTDVVTKETMGAVGLVFSVLAFLMLCTRTAIFGEVGASVDSFLLGVFGLFAYPVFLGLIYLSFASIVGKRFVRNRRAVWAVVSAVIFVLMIVHAAVTNRWSLDGYLSACFNAGKGGIKTSTPTGWIGGLCVWVLFKATTKVGAYIILSVFALMFGYLSFVFIKAGVKSAREKDSDVEAEKSAEGERAQTPFTGVPQSAPAENAQQPVRSAPVTPPQEQPVYPMQPPVTRSAPATGGEYAAYPEIRQHPGVTLPNNAMEATVRPAISQAQRPQQSGEAFSPFGALRNNRADEPERLDPRDILASDPRESYRKNLIFDENSNVNRRPNPDPYTSSYSAAYEAAINRGEEFSSARPTKISSSPINRSDDSLYTLRDESAQTATPVYPERKIEPVQPYAPAETETPYSQKEETFRSGFELRGEEETTDTRDIYTETREEPPVEERGGSGLLNIFSPSNPNVFGGAMPSDPLFGDRGREEIGRDFPEENEAELLRGRSEPTFDRDPFLRDDGLREEYRDREPIEEDIDRKLLDTPLRDREFSARDIFDEDDEIEEEDDLAPFDENRVSVEPKAEPAPPPPPKPRVHKPYCRVPLDYFDCRDVEPDANEGEVETNKRTIIETLEAFKVTDATVASVTHGPTVTRYNVVIPRNISARKVVSLDQEIAMSLYASKGVNIYPNFEDGAVSIEVPNKNRQFVQLGCMFTGEEFAKAKPTSLLFAIGKDVGNRKVYGDICKMTHLLVAGASGSGKSVFLRSLIISLITKYSPDEMRLILIDPKKTEFVIYDRLPHLMINEIITDINKVIQSLNWAIKEMNYRYTLFEQMTRAGTYVVNIDEYNANLKEGEEKLPKIVIIVDELADLMLAAKKDVEDRIQNLTQKSRAAGIHLIIATQRPSADVITGVIKGNLPTRIAFAVASDVDSRVILDASGAQKLLGKGDLLYSTAGMPAPTRVQGASIESEDAQRVVNFIRANNEAYFDESVSSFINNTRPEAENADGGYDDEGVEPKYIEALRYVITSGSASISMIQRKCSVGYNKAGKIIEWMEYMGYISAFDGAKARKVLITKEEFESVYGEL